MHPFTLNAPDGAQIAAYRSLSTGAPKAVVQIAHGMAEHFGRYARLAARLNRAGYAVYGADHRGHGASGGEPGLGSFGPGGFQAVVDDMALLTQAAKQEQPGVPFVLLGHSMGSFASQLYLLERAAELAGLVLSGTAAVDLMMAHRLAAGPDVGLESLNAGFDARTPFEWLSRDTAEVDLYVADPLCGFALDDASTASIFGLASQARHDPRLATVPKTLPIYVISGEVDPVVGPGQAFAHGLIASYEAAGLINIEHRVYPEGRHEMFNELNRDQVEDELVGWLDRTVG
jgi:alpha-beta hydrolase superfamily lysophospholipase